MENTYNVKLGELSVGRVCLKPMGMFYKLLCFCQLDKPGKYMLNFSNEKGTRRLGLLIPDSNCHSFCTTISKRELDTTNLSFYLEGSGSERLFPGRHISCLRKLPDAKLKCYGDFWSLEL